MEDICPLREATYLQRKRFLFEHSKWVEYGSKWWRKHNNPNLLGKNLGEKFNYAVKRSRCDLSEYKFIAWAVTKWNKRQKHYYGQINYILIDNLRQFINHWRQKATAQTSLKGIFNKIWIEIRNIFAFRSLQFFLGRSTWMQISHDPVFVCFGFVTAGSHKCLIRKKRSIS